MRYLPMLAAALATIAATPASATTLSRCYVETALQGTFLAAGDRHAQGSVGGGCDLTLNQHLFIGSGIRADLGDSSAAVLTGRIGLNINPHLAVYGLAGWAAPEFKFNRHAGQFLLGAGAETTVGAIKGLSLFSEATVAAAKVGAATTDDIAVRAGFRWRF